MQNQLNMPKHQILYAVLVAIGLGLLNSYMNFHPDLTKNSWVMGQKIYAHIWAYAPNLIHKFVKYQYF